MTGLRGDPNPARLRRRRTRHAVGAKECCATQRPSWRYTPKTCQHCLRCRDDELRAAKAAVEAADKSMIKLFDFVPEPSRECL